MLVAAQKYSGKLKDELKTVVFHAEISDDSKAEWNQFHTEIGNRLKEDLQLQYEKQCDEIDQLMAIYIKKIESIHSSHLRKVELFYQEIMKKLKQNQGVWISNRNFWIFVALLEALLLTSIWGIGKSLMG